MATATLNSKPEEARDRLDWWSSLRHGGLLLDSPRLSALITEDPPELYSYDQDRLRRRINQFVDNPDANRGQLVSFVLESICGFKNPLGTWSRAAEVSKDWSRKTITGETIRPNHLWVGKHDSLVPVFIEKEKRVGIGRGKKLVSNALQWLRQTGNRLAIVTNGHEWRLLYAGLDYEAHVQWDLNQWFTNGEPSDELRGFRSLVSPGLWTPETDDAQPPLLAAINDSRKGQAELSQVLGERVRQAVELLIQANAPALKQALAETEAQTTDNQPPVTNTDIYRAGVRFIMRMVVVLFAESRERLLPRDNPTYHDSYSLGGLRDQLLRQSPHRQRNNFAAFPRIISLFRLIYEGSPHPDLTISRYGGDLFRPGDAKSPDGMIRALHILENGCYSHDVMTDAQVAAILDLLSRTKIKIRQGRSGTWVPSPVDFSSLDSEYIGILYEGLLDFELRRATDDNPIIFLAVGNQPALPLSTLEAMDDKALKNLLDKMKDTSSGDDEEEDADEDTSDADQTDASADDQDGEVDDEQGDDIDAEEVAEDAAIYDIRKTLRSRAETWAHRAITAGKLVKKPRGTMTDEKKLAYQAAIDRKASQIVTRVVLPGEWYLIRWGGTRKGSGTFYTRPQLAVPTVHRTLFPLAYEVNKDDNQSQTASDQPPIPKRPEEILNLKVCDPACGSGSFPLAALRFLTDALFASLHYHDRIEYFSDRTVIDLIRDEKNEQTLSGEALPCRPEDLDFEPRTKAVLRRYVVERCIYGVDLDPLAVELCRLSLWIETLDPRLPFTFLDHKIKCGNSLVGTWFDQFMHYPPMAWMREGGDKNHGNGVHFEKEAWTKAIKAKVKDVKKELIDYIDGAKLIYKVDLSTIETVHDSAEQALRDIHQLGIHEVNQRAERYRQLRESEEFLEMQFAFDLWCSIWFWPPDRIDMCPLPMDFYENNLEDDVKRIVLSLSSNRRFFHWELEFPDVFNQRTLGFDAVVGNPPWETLQPNSKEFFSAIDPLYRTYGNQAAKKLQQGYFESQETEKEWLRFSSFYKELSTWMKHSGAAFGNQRKGSKEEHLFGIGDRGKASFATSDARHVKWTQKREEVSGYADADHAFRYQGGGKPYTHKMFLEMSHALLREGGRLGVVVPSGIYSDLGTSELRELFLEHCQWEWLFGYENKEGIFDIHRSFKFNPIVIQKGGRTGSIKTAFMRHNIEDWENGIDLAIEYPRDRVFEFSPKSKAILEIQSQEDLLVLQKIYANSVQLGGDGPDSWAVTYSQGDFNMTSDSKLFPPRNRWEENGYHADEYSRWIKGNWQSRGEHSPAPPNARRLEIPEGIILSRDGISWIQESEISSDVFKDKKGKPRKGIAIAHPLYQGVMLQAFDHSAKSWLSGTGLNANWEVTDVRYKHVSPQYLIADVFCGEPCSIEARPRFSFRDIARTTDTRTMIGASVARSPCGNTVPVLDCNDGVQISGSLLSYCYDWAIRMRMGGTHLNYYVIDESPLIRWQHQASKQMLATLSGLTMNSVRFAPEWIRYQLDTSDSWRANWASTIHERIRRQCIVDAVAAHSYGLDEKDLRWILRQCDLPVIQIQDRSKGLEPKGFWRVDKSSDPERRKTILSYIAFRNLTKDFSGNLNAFFSQNDGEGWQLPERLRLSDYGLGHDDRAREYQPVRECFGPRFYDWQLEQTPEESWRECHLHARNLLGPTGYQALLDELEGKTPTPAPQPTDTPKGQKELF